MADTVVVGLVGSSSTGGNEWIAMGRIDGRISSGTVLELEDSAAAAVEVAIETGQTVVPKIIVSVKTVVYFKASKQSGINVGHKVTVSEDMV